MGAGESLEGRERIAWPLLAIAIVYLYAIGGSHDGVGDAGTRMLSVGVVAATLVAWGLVARVDPRWYPGSVLWPAIVVLLAAFALSTLLSRNQRISLDYLAYAAILGGLYLLLQRLLAGAGFRRWIPTLVVGLTFGLTVIYLLFALGRWITWWGLVGAIAVPPLNPGGEGLMFGGPGAVAALAVMGLIVSAAHLGVARRRSRLVLLPLAILVGAVVVISGSIAAWLAAAVTVAVAVLFLAGGMDTQRARTTVRRRPVRRLLALGAIVVMILAVLAGPRTIERFLAGDTLDQRVSLAMAAGRMFVGAPVTGVGPGGWAVDRIHATVPPEVDAYVPDAGSAALQAAAELGIAGLTAGLLALACLVVLVRRALRDEDADRRRWAWATVLVAVAFGTQQLLDVLASLPAALFLFALPIAWLDATEPRPLVPLIGRLGRLRLPAMIASIVVVAVATAWAGLSERSALSMAQGQDQIAANDWVGAVPALLSADAGDPSIPAPLLPLGLAQARAGDGPAALATFTRLAERDDLPVAWINRAGLEAKGGDAVSARRSIDRALRLGAQQPQVALSAGWIHEQLGDLDDADRWYAAALALDPRIARDLFWQSEVRVARWGHIRDLAFAALSPADQVALWVAAGDLDAAGGATRAVVDGERRAFLELVVRASGDDPAGRAELAQWTRDHPGDVDGVTWSARIFGRAGDADAARRYREWADILERGAGEAGFDVAIELPPISTATKTGITSVAWGAVTYRRPTPDDQVLSDLPHLVLVP